MLGVRRSKIFASAACMVLFWYAAGIRSIDAVELGNILFPSVEQQSREASALALDAIVTALRGIAELERSKPNVSQDLLKQSAGQLNRAAQQMEAILSKAGGDPQFQRYLDDAPNIEAIPKPVWEGLVNSMQAEKLPVPKTRREMFLYFSNKTKALSANLEKPGRLSGIGDYLKLGDAVTRLMRPK